MIEWLKVVILGIVEGVTEFLPISSTGHLIIASELLHFDPSLKDSFDIFIQLGAVVAVLFYYRKDLWQQARKLPTDRTIQRFWLAVVVATIPAGAVGFLFRHRIKEVLFQPLVVALALIIGGVVFILVERNPPAERSTTQIESIGLWQALRIGIAQLFALVPGVSRSGASIIGGLFVGLDRRTATQFSFFLAMPILGAATVLEFVDALSTINSDQILMLLLGALISGIVAWFSIGWLLRYVSNNSFVVFGYYRILIGILIIIAVAARLL